MYFLIEQSELKREEDLRLNAAIHGAKLEDTPETAADSSSSNVANGDKYIFKHPDEYKNLSPEERARRTKVMMDKFSSIATKTAMKVGEQ